MRRVLTRSRRGLRSVAALIGIVAVLTSVAHAKDYEGYAGVPIRESAEVSVEYYYVEGNTFEELNASMSKRGKPDYLGVRRFAYTGWTVTWNWFDEQGNLDLSSTRCNYRAVITLPKWRPLREPDPTLAQRWRSYTYSMAKHELNHLKNVQERYGLPCKAVHAALENNSKLTEDEAKALVKGELQKIRAVDTEYDRLTSNGRTEGVHLP